jgi:hypothetical protein
MTYGENANGNHEEVDECRVRNLYLRRDYRRIGTETDLLLLDEIGGSLSESTF